MGVEIYPAAVLQATGTLKRHSLSLLISRKKALAFIHIQTQKVSMGGSNLGEKYDGLFIKHENWCNITQCCLDK